MADYPTDPALKAAADALAGVVKTLSDHKAAVGSDEMRQVQSALSMASRAYSVLSQIGAPDVPVLYPSYYDY